MVGLKTSDFKAGNRRLDRTNNGKKNRGKSQARVFCIKLKKENTNVKIAATILFLFLFGNNALSQVSFEEWEAESKTNKRLLPKYGYLRKSEIEIKSDSDYVKQMMATPQFKNRREASNHLIGLGFQYYYRGDLKTAMYRFNQAYLLDTTNSDIFWGYGAIYMAMGKYALSKKQYDEGLSIDPLNTHLLTDLGTYYMGQFYEISEMPPNDIIKDPKKLARQHIDSAIAILTKSYIINPKDVNTAYKLSISHWAIDSCAQAFKYYDEAKTLGGKPITEAYTKDLEKRCKQQDCKSVQTGTFKVVTKESGTTYIKRTPTEHTEKNDELGYEVIFDIKWINECTYELRPKKVIKGDPSIMGDGTNFVRVKIRDITAKTYIAETTASFTPATMEFLVEILDQK